MICCACFSINCTNYIHSKTRPDYYGASTLTDIIHNDSSSYHLVWSSLLMMVTIHFRIYLLLCTVLFTTQCHNSSNIPKSSVVNITTTVFHKEYIYTSFKYSKGLSTPHTKVHIERNCFFHIFKASCFICCKLIQQ